MKFLLPSILLLLAAVGCQKASNDNTDPGIVIQSPGDSLTFITGQTFVLQANLSDNDRLSQYKFDFHNNFDGHSHRPVATPWARVIIGNLPSQNSVIVSLNVTIPADAAAGVYHMVGSVVDANGNEMFADPIIMFLVSSLDSIAPVISMTAPDSGDAFLVGDTVFMTGTITDNLGLMDIDLEIVEDATSIIKYSYSESISGISYSLNTKTPTSGWPIGAYTLTVVARDTTYNIAIEKVPITVN